MNSDGKPDLATANFNSATVSLLLNRGTTGTTAVIGPVADIAGSALTLVGPNPTAGGSRSSMRWRAPGRVLLELLDVGGRVVAILADRIQGPGRLRGPRGTERIGIGRVPPESTWFGSRRPIVCR
mgnify:CR=1 FL=1